MIFKSWDHERRMQVTSIVLTTYNFVQSSISDTSSQQERHSVRGKTYENERSRRKWRGGVKATRRFLEGICQASAALRGR